MSILHPPPSATPGLINLAGEIDCDTFSTTVYVFDTPRDLENEIAQSGYQNGIDLVGNQWEASVADPNQAQRAIGGRIVSPQ